MGLGKRVKKSLNFNCIAIWVMHEALVYLVFFIVPWGYCYVATTGRYFCRPAVNIFCDESENYMVFRNFFVALTDADKHGVCDMVYAACRLINFQAEAHDMGIKVMTSF